MDDTSNLCFKRIVYLVKYRERCQEELRERLVTREHFSEDDFSKAIEKAKAYDLVNDERYAEFYVYNKSHSYYGAQGIRFHLQKMKIEYVDMPVVMELLSEAENNDFSNAKYILNRCPSRSKNIFSGNVKKLVNRGFSTGLAIKAVSEWMRD